jgi:hypothetical protein
LVVARADGRAARTTGETTVSRAVAGVTPPVGTAVAGRTTTRTAGAATGAGDAPATPGAVTVAVVDAGEALSPIATVIDSAAPALRPRAATRLRAAA